MAVTIYQEDVQDYMRNDLKLTDHQFNTLISKINLWVWDAMTEAREDERDKVYAGIIEDLIEERDRC